MKTLEYTTAVSQIGANEDDFEITIIDRDAFKKSFNPDKFLDDVGTLMNQPKPKSSVSSTSSKSNDDSDYDIFE